MAKITPHWIAKAHEHLNNNEFSLGYFDGTQAQAIKYFRAKKNVKRYFRPGYTVTIQSNPIVLYDGYGENPVKKKVSRKKISRKKVSRKKNPASKKKDHLWVIFLCRGRSISYINFGIKTSFGFTSVKGKATLFQTQSEAARVAQSAANSRRGKVGIVGVAYASVSPAEIKKSCRASSGRSRPGKK